MFVPEPPMQGHKPYPEIPQMQAGENDNGFRKFSKIMEKLLSEFVVYIREGHCAGGREQGSDACLLVPGTGIRTNMVVSGKIYIEGKLIRESVAEDNEREHSFRDKLEVCLVGLCANLDIPVPLWLKKNTRELAAFKKTFFSSEQFIEPVWFDRLEISLQSSDQRGR